jgi:murein DD-endopeptidase MepM/ murein hydrolase activator NlpD
MKIRKIILKNVNNLFLLFLISIFLSSLFSLSVLASDLDNSEPTDSSNDDSLNDISSNYNVNFYPQIFRYGNQKNNNLLEALVSISYSFREKNIDMTNELLSSVIATLRKEVPSSFLPIEEYGDYCMGQGCSYKVNGQCRSESYNGGCDYKGRGYIQLTHKYNYEAFGGQDFLTSSVDECDCKGKAYCSNQDCAPAKALLPEYAGKLFVAYYIDRDLIAKSSSLDFWTVGKRINGGDSYANDFSGFANHELMILNTHPKETQELLSYLSIATPNNFEKIDIDDINSNLVDYQNSVSNRDLLILEKCKEYAITTSVTNCYAIVKAIIDIESEGNFESVSKSGCVGLIQICDDVAYKANFEMGDSYYIKGDCSSDSCDVTNDFRFDETKNLDVGIKYLMELYNEFNNNLYLTALAYNLNIDFAKKVIYSISEKPKDIVDKSLVLKKTKEELEKIFEVKDSVEVLTLYNGFNQFVSNFETKYFDYSGYDKSSLPGKTYEELLRELGSYTVEPKVAFNINYNLYEAESIFENAKNLVSECKKSDSIVTGEEVFSCIENRIEDFNDDDYSWFVGGCGDLENVFELIVEDYVSCLESYVKNERCKCELRTGKLPKNANIEIRTISQDLNSGDGDINTYLDFVLIENGNEIKKIKVDAFNLCYFRDRPGISNFFGAKDTFYTDNDKIELNRPMTISVPGIFNDLDLSKYLVKFNDNTVCFIPQKSLNHENISIDNIPYCNAVTQAYRFCVQSNKYSFSVYNDTSKKVEEKPIEYKFALSFENQYYSGNYFNVESSFSSLSDSQENSNSISINEAGGSIKNNEMFNGDLGINFQSPLKKEDEPIRNGLPKCDKFNYMNYPTYSSTYYPGRWNSVHRGIDIYSNDNLDNFYAVTDGVIFRVTNYGVYQKVDIDNDNYQGTLTIVYGHTIGSVKAGQEVKAGDYLGRISYSIPHIHLEMYFRDDGSVISSGAPSSKFGNSGAKVLDNDKYLIDPKVVMNNYCD